MVVEQKDSKRLHVDWAWPELVGTLAQLLGADGTLSKADTDLHLSPGCLWGCREANQVLIQKTHKQEIGHRLLRWVLTDAAQHRRAQVSRLTVAVHPVIRGIKAEVSRVVLTPVWIQVAGEALRGGRTATDQEPDRHTCDSCLLDYSRFFVQTMVKLSC